MLAMKFYPWINTNDYVLLYKQQVHFVLKSKYVIRPIAVLKLTSGQSN